MRALIQLGGTMENQGRSLHVAGFRMDVRNIPDLEQGVWNEVERTVMERLGVVRKDGSR